MNEDIILSCNYCGSNLLILTQKYDNEELAALDVDPITSRVIVRCDICCKEEYSHTDVGGTFSISSPDDINFEPISDLDNKIRTDNLMNFVVLRAWRG